MPKIPSILDSGHIRKSVYHPKALVIIRALAETFGEEQQKLSFWTIPTSFHITRNSYRQPDSWSIEFDSKDFPIQPSLVRTGQVTIYLYDSIKPEIERGDVRDKEPLITGLLDSVSVEFSESGRTVSFDGQDMTSLFVGTQFKRRRRNFNNLRLDKAIENLMGEVDKSGEMSLILDIPFSPSKLPIIGRSVSRTNKKGFPAKKGEKYWDVMYNLALKHGFILYVKGLTLILSLPETLEGTTPDRPNKISDREKARLQAIDTKRRKQAESTFLMVWGKNLESVNMERTMGKQRVPQIEVTAYDAKKRKTLIGKYPEKKQVVVDGLGTKRNSVITSVVYGITDIDTLRTLAKLQYTLIARSEQLVNIKTRDMEDDNGSSLLYIGTGDRVWVAFDPYNTEGLAKVPKERRVRWLMDRSWTLEAATIFAEGFERAKTFNKPFFVREATIDWSKDDGVSIEIRMVNFVTTSGSQGESNVKEAKSNV